MPEANQKSVGVLAIQGDYAAHQHVLQELGVPSLLVRKAEQLEQVAGLILPGGESTTLLKFLDGESLWEPLRSFAQQHPVFGTCAGAILMATEVENPAQRSQGLMDISVRRNAFGRQVFSFIRHATLTKAFTKKCASAAPSEGSIEAVFIRAPVILRCGSSVQTLVTLDDSPVLVQQGNLLAATFHPEMSSQSCFGHLVHQYFSSLIFGHWPNR
jgi:5'-phosphate synthase pdxT subunit